jgi:flagellar hook-associated protein 1 FlgK
VPQPQANTTGLGASGTLSTPFAAPLTLGNFAEAITGAEANDSANAASQLGTEQAMQTTLTNQVSSQSGVSIDQQMSLMIQLQNAYGANAKVMSAVQNMFSELLNAVSS